MSTNQDRRDSAILAADALRRMSGLDSKLPISRKDAVVRLQAIKAHVQSIPAATKPYHYV